MNGERPEPARRRPRWPIWVLVGAIVVAGGGLIAVAVAGPGSSSAATDASSSTSATSVASCPVTSVASKVLPSVVTVAAQGADGGGTGSGELIRSDGYILTNNHVIAIAADGGSVQVLFADGTSEPATIVGRDVLTDLAVLKVASTEGMQPIAIGSSASLVVGEPVVVLGAPLGLSGTVTSGIVSALDRTIEVPAEGDTSALLVNAVQTDAAINPGNSGGSMVNCDGQLVGIPSAGATVPSASGESAAGSIGLGFAIPVDTATTIANEIISTGKATHAFFGVQTQPIPPSAATEGGVPQGLYVAGVVPNGPAAKAGLQKGDVITTIAGQPATTNTQLQEQTLTKSAGDTVQIGYSRGGKQETTTVTLGTQP
jgi:putative serine protease PepD